MSNSPLKGVLAAVAAATTLTALVSAPAQATTPQIGSAPAATGTSAPARATAGDPLGTTPTKAPRATRGIDKKVHAGKPAAAARAHLTEHAGTYHLDADSLKEIATTSTAKGHSSVRFQQTYDGVPVFGAQYVVQTRNIDGGVRVDSTTGHVYTELSGSMKPAVSQTLAQQRLHLDQTVASIEDPTITAQGLVVLPNGSGSPAWQFEVSGTSRAGKPISQQVFVDGRVGGIALSFNTLDTADDPGEPATATGTTFRGSTVTLQVTRTVAGSYELRDQSRAMHATNGGELRTYDAQGRNYTEYSGTMPADTPIYTSPTTTFNGAATSIGAVDAQLNAGKVYEFLRSHLDRNSIDGKGGTMNSVVNVTSNGKEYANAFWDGTKMVYGSYNGVPFASTLDVVGHEMTHGITEHTANLIYLNQSGALNEAVSDYFGNAMEDDDLGIAMNDPDSGLIGEYLCTDKAPKDCALRDLNDGRVAGTDYQLLPVDYDNGGVHANSTIVGGALWDIRQKLGGTITDQLVYAAQTDYLTPLSNFTDMRTAVEYAAKAQGLSAAQLADIGKAFDDHGIYSGWEEKTRTSDATPLIKDMVPTYEGWAQSAQTSAAIDGDRWASSVMDVEKYFAGDNQFNIVTGEFGKPDKTRTINDHDGWDLNPAMDGDRLVWTRITPTSVDIVEQKGEGLGGTRVVAGSEGDQIMPSVSGTTVAWLDVRGDETDVWVKQGDEPARNLTAASGTHATRVAVHGDDLAWVDSGHTVNTVNLTDGRTSSKKIPGWVFTSVKSLQFNATGLFVQTSGFGDSVLFADPADATTMRKLDFGKGLYSASFTVNDDYAAFDTYGPWSILGSAPSNEEMPKVQIAPVQDLLAGKATWQRAACGAGAEIAPQLGDGQRLVWLDTSYARTDLVTRESIAGTC
ncbi:MAG TPA: M4 family metallopeptidase [Flexivirga sp.]|uniref:M4 family metallopeptidase n=1 Tax=Flexivirga sp. TaxID=1962927 RepID=UPI002BAA93E8|nr:M4 family metallopeptidase [Flexivirga sp.]HWC22907.1 M4 family metallopeptidase [Flexivirga sp.]